MSDFVFAFEAATLAPGHGRTVHLNGRDLAIFNVDGAFYAIDDTCPHKGGPLGVGLADGTEVSCPLHGWVFDVRTGACLTKPGCSVRTYAIRVHEGDVQVNLQAE